MDRFLELKRHSLSAYFKGNIIVCLCASVDDLCSLVANWGPVVLKNINYYEEVITGYAFKRYFFSLSFEIGGVHVFRIFGQVEKLGS